MKFDFGAIVIGAGHAGCEAASACARLGVDTLLISFDLNKIAQMSCNPAMGGIAKGQIVREIDALGGMSGVVTDLSSIQFRMLNRSKGPAVWSPRSQCDRMAFSANWRHFLENTPNLSMWQDEVVSMTFSPDGRVSGVLTAMGARFTAPVVILTAGTFLNGLMHVGHVKWPGGRVAEPAASSLSASLVERGIPMARMKTGTPVRIDGRSIDFSCTETQFGDETGERFSFLPVERKLASRPCYIVHTNEQTHRILRDALPLSPLYNGQIKSIGPRYCPSIETKINTFPDKSSHQLFIEPEGETTNEFYLNGFSSSLPMDVQIKALETIPAFRHIHIFRPGYAIEYDYFDPLELQPTLESKHVPGLFLAGQVNGTTGYEEAAGQGLVAGINAAAAVKAKDPLILHRDQAYIGVLIDDLVTKGVDEPYRMFTSRAEHRILLRQDNADMRLTPLGRELGLVSDDRFSRFEYKMQEIDSLSTAMSEIKVKPESINAILENLGTSPLSQSLRLDNLVTRPQLNMAILADAVPALAQCIASISPSLRQEVTEAVEINLKYAGYIDREKLNSEKLRRLDKLVIPSRIDYSSLKSLSTEARQKLASHRPLTIGQASRIPGVSPNDISVLLLILGK